MQNLMVTSLHFEVACCLEWAASIIHLHSYHTNFIHLNRNDRNSSFEERSQHSYNHCYSNFSFSYPTGNYSLNTRTGPPYLDIFNKLLIKIPTIHLIFNFYKYNLLFFKRILLIEIII